ncbi:MAG: uracil-DNA glycosylase [Coprobacillus sp.]|nr:uracil-DNA glycosylase [Coprobacillus sp.]
MKTEINTWNEFFNEIKEEDYSKYLYTFLDKEYAEHDCLPKRKDVFKAFELTPLNEVKVVILGQDPYINDNQAMGLSFSVPEGQPLPPSLINIYSEIEREFGGKMDYQSGDLTYLARQGVLLLNTILSVRKGESMSHNIPQYHEFSAEVFQLLDSIDRPMVFLLWGNYAKGFKKYITNPKHKVLTAVHPSPLSANRGGWFGCNNFIDCNKFLEENNIKPIHWENAL